MELMETDQRAKRKRAKKKVEELKGFYIHLTVYVLVNIMISLVIIVAQVSDGESVAEAVLNFGVFSTWLFWGIGLFFHGIKVFRYNPIFNRNWEERQIQKYMEQDRQEAEKYR
jgi:3'-phosphoadenosine 5'-phosphosulfate sulfotransferase (PAPS reductase)/FAD synthetase